MHVVRCLLVALQFWGENTFIVLFQNSLGMEYCVMDAASKVAFWIC